MIAQRCFPRLLTLFQTHSSHVRASPLKTIFIWTKFADVFYMKELIYAYFGISILICVYLYLCFHFILMLGVIFFFPQ